MLTRAPVRSRCVQSARDLILRESERERALRVIPPWPENCGWGSPSSAEYAGVHFKRSIASSVAVVESKAMKRDHRLSLSSYYAFLERPPYRPMRTGWHACDGNDDGETDGAEGERRRDIGDYMRVVRRQVSGLDESQCASYVSFVERALVPGVEFTEAEYASFVEALLGIVRAIEQSPAR
jgi:hypothetical protein